MDSEPVGPTQSTPRRLALGGEVVGYVGGALALGALTALASNVGPVAQIAVSGLEAAAGLVGGWILAASATPSTRRLGYVLLFLGTIALGGTVGLLTGWLTPDRTIDGYFANTVANASGMVVGAIVWWRHRTAIQLVVVAGAMAGTIYFALNRWARWEDVQLYTASALFALGCLWALAGEVGWLTPRGAAWAIGCVGILAAPQLLTLHYAEWPSGSLPHIAGCIVSLALLAVAAWRRRGTALGFGAAGLAIYAPQALNSLYPGSVTAPVVLLFIGVMLIGLSVLAVSVWPRVRGRAAGARVPETGNGGGTRRR